MFAKRSQEGSFFAPEMPCKRFFPSRWRLGRLEAVEAWEGVLEGLRGSYKFSWQESFFLFDKG